MQQIDLILKNTKLGSYHHFSWLIAFLNIAAQLLLASTTSYGNIFIALGVLLITLLLFFISKQGYSYLKDKKHHIIAVIYTAISVTWIKWEIHWAAGIVIVFYILYIAAIRRFEVNFSRKHISYPSFPRKEIQWNELSNVIMKDGILTIDFKDNKLIQAETEETNTVNEKEFNEFCKKQLQ